MPSKNFLLSISAWPALAALCLGACGPGADAPAGTNKATAVSDVDALAGIVTVSGVSAGGYMAVQSQVALADLVSGAAALAAGPYHCAGGSVATALAACLSGEGLDVAELLEFTATKAASGAIAPLTQLAKSRVWIFHSPVDSVVAPQAGQALAAYFAGLLPADNVRYVTAPAAGHGWPTLSTGVECGAMGGDFLNACDFDAAGTFLAYLYGGLDAPRHESLSAELRTIDVSTFFSTGSVADSAYAFVPSDCAVNAANCRLHIAFHGCRQGAEFIGDRFASQAGLNEWADGNRIVVLYPQVEKSLMNPQGCWDWWGYTGDEYDLAKGAQLSGIRALIVAFANGALF